MRIESCTHPNYFVIDGRVIHEASISLLTARGLLVNPEHVETARGDLLREQTYALQGAEALALFSQGAFYHIDADGGIIAGKTFNIAQFDVPDGVKIIRESGFRGVECLVEVSLPSSVEAIEADAFNGCRNLSSVTLNFGLKRIGPRAFRGTAIRRMEMPSSVEFIAPQKVFPRTAGRAAVDRNIPVACIKAVRACGWRAMYSDGKVW
jgi:hypothetical protein